MATDFPSGIDTFTNPTPTDYLNSPSHAGQHANANDAIEAIEAKLGIDGSAVTTSHDKILSSGWNPSGETWTYSSVDDPTGVITVPSDATTKYSVGMRISFVNGGNTIYGIITAVTSTSITFLHEIDPTDSQALTLMANSAITSPQYSTQKAPFGFPLEPNKWTIQAKDTLSRTQASAVSNTWYNLGSVSIDIPIGCWRVKFNASGGVVDTSNTDLDFFITLSTANNSESDSEFTCFTRLANMSVDFRGATNLTTQKILELSSKTSYYLNSKTLQGGGATTTLQNNNHRSPAIIEAICAYL